MKNFFTLIFLLLLFVETAMSQSRRDELVTGPSALIPYNGQVFLISGKNFFKVINGRLHLITRFEGEFYTQIVSEERIFVVTKTRKEYILYQSDGTIEGSVKVKTLKITDDLFLFNEEIYFADISELQVEKGYKVYHKPYVPFI